MIQGYVIYGGRPFYEERAPGSDNFDLIVSDGAGRRKLVDIAALRAANGGKPFAINYFLASPDGSKAAVGVSEGGSEDASISVYDAASGARIAGPLDRAAIRCDGLERRFSHRIFHRLKKLGPSEPPTEKYQNSTLDAWDLKTEPVSILGPSVGHGPPFKPTEFPVLGLTVGAPMAAALSINGVQNELAVWLAPVGRLADKRTAWTPFITREDGVTGMDMRGSEIFLLSHKDAPTFKVLSVAAGRPLSARPRSLCPPSPIASSRASMPPPTRSTCSRVAGPTRSCCASRRERAPSRRFRCPSRDTSAMRSPIRAPPGIAVELSSWVVPPDIYAYRPASKSFNDLKIGTHGDIDPSAYTVQNLEAKARDGAMVPLSLMQRKGATGPQITLIEAYGSYGISELADFSVRAGGRHARGHHVRHLPRAGRRGAGRGVASRRQGCEQAQHLGGSHRLRRSI